MRQRPGRFDKNFIIHDGGRFFLFSTTLHRRLSPWLTEERFMGWYVLHMHKIHGEIFSTKNIADECRCRLGRAKRYGTSSHDWETTPERIMQWPRWRMLADWLIRRIGAVIPFQ